MRYDLVDNQELEEVELDVSKGDIRKQGYLDLKRLRAKNKSFFDEDSSMVNDQFATLTDQDIVMSSIDQDQVQTSSYSRNPAQKRTVNKKTTKVHFP